MLSSENASRGVPPRFLRTGSHLFIVARQVMIVVRERGSLFPLVCRSFSAPSAVELAARKSTDRGPSRDPSSLALKNSRFVRDVEPESRTKKKHFKLFVCRTRTCYGCFISPRTISIACRLLVRKKTGQDVRKPRLALETRAWHTKTFHDRGITFGREKKTEPSRRPHRAPVEG